MWKYFITLHAETHFAIDIIDINIFVRTYSTHDLFFSPASKIRSITYQLNDKFYFMRALYLCLKCYHLWCTLNFKRIFWYWEVRYISKFILENANLTGYSITILHISSGQLILMNWVEMGFKPTFAQRTKMSQRRFLKIASVF